jgi:hypothetical protein
MESEPIGSAASGKSRRPICIQHSVFWAEIAPFGCSIRAVALCGCAQWQREKRERHGLPTCG